MKRSSREHSKNKKWNFMSLISQSCIQILACLFLRLSLLLFVDLELLRMRMSFLYAISSEILEIPEWVVVPATSLA